MKISQFVANALNISRRAACDLIKENKIFINSQACSSFSVLLNKEDRVYYKNKELKLKNATRRIWAFYKPVGVVSSHHDPEGRPTIIDAFKRSANIKHSEKICYVGRLDINSEGLIIFTDDGNLANKLAHPSYEVTREYEVDIYGLLDSNYSDNMDDKSKKAYSISRSLDFEELKSILSKGVEIEGEKYGPIKFELLHSKKNNHKVKLTLKEGKNREIRNILKHFGFKISKLVRISYGSLRLGDMKPGESCIVNAKEVFAC